MDGERSLAGSPRLPRLAAKFHDKQYRDAYVAAHAREVLAKQMRNFRGDLSQAEYAVKIDKQKTVVGRLENPAYGGWSLRTMLEVARKENVAVIARFVDFPTFMGFTDDLSGPGPSSRRLRDMTEADEFAAFASQATAGEPANTRYYNVSYPLGHIETGTIMLNAPPVPYSNMFFGSGQAVAFNNTGNIVPGYGYYYPPPLFLQEAADTGMRELVR